MDWNMFLNEDGGPSHWLDEQRESGKDPAEIWVGASPVMIDRTTGELTVTSSYYYLGHFSKFIKRGARRIGYSIFDTSLEAGAFLNPDGSIAVVVLNRWEEDRQVTLRYHGELADLTLKAHSIQTLLF